MQDDRKLLDKSTEKVTYLQILGFVLIAAGVVCILISLTPVLTLTGECLSVIFFIIMLGVAFSFPDLLQDQNQGISTMRLVTFMMINVICMLLLKIGWLQPSLNGIGINAYWMGIIAFVFGAKATQAYFESKMAVPTTSGLPTAAMPAAPDTADFVKKAITQNANLISKFPNIIDISLGSMTIAGRNIYCADIHLSNNGVTGIPTELQVDINGTPHYVPVHIVPDVGSGTAHAAMGGNAIKNATTNTAAGTLGCVLTDDAKQSFFGLSCCHVFTGNKWLNYNGYNIPKDQICDDTTGLVLGNWSYGLMNTAFDIAYTDIAGAGQITPSGFAAERDVNDDDIRNKTAVSFRGATTPHGAGIISNYQCTRPVYYGLQQVNISNLILITTAANIAPSHAGDSGALVYTTTGNEPIGMIIAADTVFSYVIPITSILAITGKYIY
ncbi:MAG TPA: hypothetical protein VHA56_06340 [Mucilaginibacter sp.]|nr:hypothetical protein [Mucilaginibacter sp.]